MHFPCRPVNFTLAPDLTQCGLADFSRYDSRQYTAKGCAYSCQHSLWRHAGVGKFGDCQNVMVRNDYSHGGDIFGFTVF